MSDFVVRLEDVFSPKLYTRYNSLDFLTKNVYFNSGVAFADPRIDRLMGSSEGGQLIQLPFWNTITEDEPSIASDDPATKIETSKITSGTELAAKNFYAKAFSTMDLAGALAGSDPMAQIINQIEGYWLNTIDTMVLKSSVGIVADSITNHDSDLIIDVTANTGGSYTDLDSKVTADSIIDARGMLGDMQEDCKIMYCHSAVYTNLQKQDLIETVKNSENNTFFDMYNGMRIIHSDKAPVVSMGGGKYAYYTFIYGPNVFSLNLGSVPVHEEVERDPSAGNGSGQNKLYTRRSILVHPRGYKVNDSLITNTKSGLTWDEFAAGTTWTRVYNERKRIKFVAIKSLG